MIYCHEVGSRCLTKLNKNRNKCGLFANVNRPTRTVISLRKKPSCIYIYIYNFSYLKTCCLLFGLHIAVCYVDLLKVQCNVSFGCLCIIAPNDRMVSKELHRIRKGALVA